MSKRPEEFGTYADWIAEDFQRCDISVPQFFSGYYLPVRLERGLGAPKHGQGQDALRRWVDGKSEPGLTEYTVLYEALRRRLHELELEPTLPEIPFLSSGSGDGVPLQVIEGRRRFQSHAAPARHPSYQQQIARPAA